MRTPPGWYADSERPGGQRYFDGENWTEQRVAPGTRPPETARARTERRARNWRWGFWLFLALGALGSGLLALASAEQTTLFGDTSYDADTAITVFVMGFGATLVAALPMLGFAHILQAQVELHE